MGRVIFWVFLVAGIGCLGYALYILLAWPAPPPDPLGSSWITNNMLTAFAVGWLGLALITAALLAHLLGESDHTAE